MNLQPNNKFVMTYVYKIGTKKIWLLGLELTYLYERHPQTENL